MKALGSQTSPARLVATVSSFSTRRPPSILWKWNNVVRLWNNAMLHGVVQMWTVHYDILYHCTAPWWILFSYPCSCQWQSVIHLNLIWWYYILTLTRHNTTHDDSLFPDKYQSQQFKHIIALWLHILIQQFIHNINPKMFGTKSLWYAYKQSKVIFPINLVFCDYHHIFANPSQPVTCSRDCRHLFSNILTFFWHN